MSSLFNELLMTADHFLQWQNDQEILHDLVGGKKFPLPARDPAFFRVLVNVTMAVKRHLGDSELASSIRGQAVVVDDYTVIHPDAIVAARFAARPAPVLVFELVGSGPRAADIVRRSVAARRLPTVREHVSVDMAARAIEVRRRDDAGHWKTLTFSEGEMAELASIDLRLDVAAAFKGLDAPDPRLSGQEFLDWDADEDCKHEFIDGRIVSMTGAKFGHVTTCINLSTALNIHLLNTPCRVLMADFRLQGAGQNYYFPDVSVTCEPLTADHVAMQSPLLLIEVLSKSTRAKDRGVKREEYLRIPSLREYVLVDCVKRRIDIHRRGPDGAWSLHQFIADAPLRLESLDLEIPAAFVFANVPMAA
ncbi:Uma2 family endonuclease [Mitsuaria sp. 7]|uniref:Uma2 family endonuclease n=1 Tax=Mitsuaria sp. 7 TaxID=1658665 RepID=UPI0009ED6607|nr:Uma2 family endonuclease [Mitsuaria sp. 7]